MYIDIQKRGLSPSFYNRRLGCLLHLNLNIHTAREREGLEGFDGLERRFREVDEAAVRAHFELVTGVLVNECRLVHRELADARGEWDRAMDNSAAALSSVDDLRRSFVQHAVIECGEADADTGNTAFGLGRFLFGLLWLCSFWFISSFLGRGLLRGGLLCRIHRARGEKEQGDKRERRKGVAGYALAGF